jgi:hypothetical protein
MIVVNGFLVIVIDVTGESWHNALKLIDLADSADN